jgi:hypothetical protein
MGMRAAPLGPAERKSHRPIEAGQTANTVREGLLYKPFQHPIQRYPVKVSVGELRLYLRV